MSRIAGVFLFCFFCCSSSYLGAYAVSARRNENTTRLLNKIKKEVTPLVLNDHRVEAISLIEENLKTSDVETRTRLNELKFNILNQFLSLNSQEAFETAASAILIDKKKALNNLQLCLTLEPDNLQCQWLELKYFKRYNGDTFIEKATKYIEKIQDLRQGQLLKYSLSLVLGQVNEVPSNLKTKSTNPEDEFLNNIISYSLAIQTHDLNRAKEALNFFAQKTNDYPDLIFMNYQATILWPELSVASPAEIARQYEVYKKKCADLPASIARKYLYDVALCTRSLK